LFHFLPFFSDQDIFDSSQNYQNYAKKGDPWENDLFSLKNHVRALHSLHQLAVAVENKQFGPSKHVKNKEKESREKDLIYEISESEKLGYYRSKKRLLNNENTDTEYTNFNTNSTEDDTDGAVTGEIIINRNTTTLEKSKPYDAVIFLRPDVRFISDIPVQLLSLYPDTLFVPDFHRSCRGKFILFFYFSIFLLVFKLHGNNCSKLYYFYY
jgi:hypothetical protein